MYLDDNKEFYDYHTSNVDGNKIFDTNKASNSYAQQILDNDEYIKQEENKCCEVVEMSPTEYFTRCAEDCFDEPVEKLINSRRRDTKVLEHLKQVIIKYKRRFPIPYIDYAEHVRPSQEGLHRMMVAGDLFGWDTKFPVQIIKWCDEEKAKEAKESKHRREIERYLQRVIDRALRYKYYNIEELKDQLRSEFESEVEYIEEFENRDFELELQDLDDVFVVMIDNKYQAEIDKNKLQLLNSKADIDRDLDDLDYKDLSDWMKELLGESFGIILKEHHVKPEEFLVSDELIADLKEKFGDDFATEGSPKDICAYVAHLCNACQLMDFMTKPWIYQNYTLEDLDAHKYAVIKYGDKVYDYTCPRFYNQGVNAINEYPRVLDYSKSNSDALGINLYINDNYAVSI